MEIEFFNALVRVSIEDAHAETIAGYVINQLGKIPASGEEFVIKGLKIRILDSDGRRIKSIEVGKLR